MRREFTITARSNEESKTFDITKLWNDGTAITYRTTELSQPEFEDMEYNTEEDWIDFLKTSGSYYEVK